MIIGCIITGITVFVVTVLVASMICQESIKCKRSVWEDRTCDALKERNLWRNRCYLMNKRIRETADMLVHTQPAPRIETQWDDYFKEGE